MTEEQYNLVIFGATGFTGQFVVEEVARICWDAGDVTFAIAGRKEEKLLKVLEMARTNTGLDLTDVGIIIADVADESSIAAMAQKAKVVINCVGPYRFYGETVVRSCIENGADMVDISGEPEYLERMQLEYGPSAKEKGVHIISACGFDSVPADVGTAFLKKVFEGDLNSVEMVVGFHDTSKGSASVNVTTLECALHGVAQRGQLRKIRKQLYSLPLPKSSFKPKQRSTIFWHSEAARWCVPNMAADRSVVMRSQQLGFHQTNERPVQFSAFFGMQSLITAIGSVMFGVVFAIMSSFSITRKLMIKYPRFFTFGLFSLDGARREDLKDLKFCVTLIGSGWHDKLEDPAEQHESAPHKNMTVQVVGPDPGYFGTAAIVTQCAMTVLKEKENIPDRGGVFPPGFAFRKTSLIDNLEKQGISFSIVSK